MNNLNERYSSIILFLERNSEQYCQNKEIKICIEIPEDDELNAGVGKIGDGKYLIKIFPGCLNLYPPVESITARYNEDDWTWFQRFSDLMIFEKYDDETFREKLDNLFSSTILLHIYWHEIGHIEAGYVDRMRNYDEFTARKAGSYSQQEQEMVADWLSVKQVFKYVYSTVINEAVYDSEELVTALKKLVVLIWLSLTIEFQIFDAKHDDEKIDFSTLTHPYPPVRLLYCLEAMAEAVADVLVSRGLDDDSAEKGMHVIIDDIYILIQSFMQITNSPIDVKKDQNEMIKYYKTLRDVPYADEYVSNDFLHLQRMDDSYRESIEKLLKDCNYNE